MGGNAQLRQLEHNRSYSHFIEFPSSLVDILLLFSTSEVFGHFNQPILILSIVTLFLHFSVKSIPNNGIGLFVLLHLH